MSATNARRHGHDLHIRDKDLVTGRDVRRLNDQFAAEFTEWVEGAIARAISEERERAAAERQHNVWYRRLLRAVRRPSPSTVSPKPSE